MELDRPYCRTTTTNTGTSELFICFSSRLTSPSSMKLTKSILSPGRAARDGGPVSLSSSHSRRLRTTGSLKGGASPFFTTSGKKRGCGYENPEPTSPKVTCIGQVRVKTKKRVRQTRNLSRRRSGDVSFRTIEQRQADLGHNNEEKLQGRYSSASNSHYKSQNQRWAHLPISICEALKAFGAEFSCLFPCKSPCFSSKRGKREEKPSGNENGCGAAFTRWLVSVNDGEGGTRREIELVVGGGDEEEERRVVSMRRSSRRHVFEDIEVMGDKIVEVKGQSCNLDEEEKGRVSVCIPPKNALLLMRCRSDPMKVAALASRFSWDANDNANAAVSEHENGDLEEEEKNCNEIEEFETEYEDKGEILYNGDEGSGDFEQNVGVSVESCENIQKIPVEAETENIEEELVINAEDGLQSEIGEEDNEMFVGEEEEEYEEVESNMSSFEALLDQENADHQNYEDCPIQENEQVSDHLSSSTESEVDIGEVTLDDENHKTESEEKTHQEYEEIRANEFSIIDEESEKEKEKEKEKKKEKENPPVLPDCLLLMMREPKLSMEVSKETWVCSTDFIRWLPERPPKAKEAKSGGGGGCHHQPVKRRLSTDSKPKHLEKIVNDQPPPVQPRRSSCSLPPKPASMATMIEQKLVNAVAYEPFVLTRCKSEPMRTAGAKLMPDSFLWKNAMRKMEPHRRATVGAAGVGF